MKTTTKTGGWETKAELAKRDRAVRKARAAAVAKLGWAPETCADERYGLTTDELVARAG
jgi:hypothetical protein